MRFTLKRNAFIKVVNIQLGVCYMIFHPLIERPLLVTCMTAASAGCCTPVGLYFARIDCKTH
jgi:hypothetical protein